MLPIRNTDERWGIVTIGLHWLTVLAVVGLVVVGFVMQELPSGRFKIDVYALHKSFGLTVFGLTVLRLLWRLLWKTPAPEPMPRWQAFAAQGSHVLLYVVLLAMPLSGWLYNSASGFPLRWFGQFALPKLTARNHDVAEFFEETHETLFLVLAALVTVHAAAALYHHYLKRDRTLQRMLPPVGPPPARIDASAPPVSVAAPANDIRPSPGA
jgi:cytochrome b561